MDDLLHEAVSCRSGGVALDLQGSNRNVLVAPMTARVRIDPTDTTVAGNSFKAEIAAGPVRADLMPASRPQK